MLGERKSDPDNTNTRDEGCFQPRLTYPTKEMLEKIYAHVTAYSLSYLPPPTRQSRPDEKYDDNQVLDQCSHTASHGFYPRTPTSQGCDHHRICTAGHALSPYILWAARESRHMLCVPG